MRSKTGKSRLIVAAMIAGSVIAGLLSRIYAMWFPDAVNLILGDAIWAYMVYYLFRFVWPGKTAVQIGVISLLFSFLIEISQLYHASWIDGIRQTRLGGLILGFGFLWSDLMAYILGILLAVAVDQWIKSRIIPK